MAVVVLAAEEETGMVVVAVVMGTMVLPELEVAVSIYPPSLFPGPQHRRRKIMKGDSVPFSYLLPLNADSATLFFPFDLSVLGTPQGSIVDMACPSVLGKEMLTWTKDR